MTQYANPSLMCVLNVFSMSAVYALALIHQSDCIEMVAAVIKE